MDELLFDGNTAIETILDDAAAELEVAATDVIEYNSTDIDAVAEIEDEDVDDFEDDEELKEEIDYLADTNSYDDDVITYPVYEEEDDEDDQDVDSEEFDDEGEDLVY